METPSSTRMVTRSQARAALCNSTHNVSVSKNGEESEKNLQTSRPKTAKQDRSVLIDITNDSPIVGLAGKSVVFEMETPSSAVSNQRRNAPKSTPGSGEALLRGQVKTLLQKVEEEAEVSMFLGSTTHGRRQFLGLRGFPNSPMGLLAPTPANTPHVSGSGEEPVVVDLFTEYPIEDKLKICQVVSELFDGKMLESSVDSDKSLITRSLLLDFSEKSDLPTVDEDLSSPAVWDCSSVITYESSKEKEEEEEDASIWSIQVNASTRGEDEDIETEDEVEVEEDDEEFYENEDYEEEGEDDADGLVDALCEGMSKISVVGFEGKHTRFVYNSKDEIEGEEEVVHLKGVASPQGKHLRFDAEEDV